MRFLAPWRALIGSAVLAIALLAYLGIEHTKYMIAIGSWAAPIILGLMTLDIFAFPDPKNRASVVLLPWLVAATLGMIYGFGHEQLNAELESARATLIRYRDALEEKVTVPVSGGQPRPLHAFMLALQDIKEVKILGINGLSVLDNHRSDLERVLANGRLSVLLLSRDSDEFNERVNSEEQVDGRTAGRIEEEWEASMAILRDILNQVRRESGESIWSLEERFQVRLHRKQPDRSILYVDGYDYVEKEGKREPQRKKYLLYNRYPEDLELAGFKSLSLLVDDRFVEWHESLDYWEKLWNDPNTEPYSLQQMQREMRKPRPSKASKLPGAALSTVARSGELVDAIRRQKRITSQTWELSETIELDHPIYHPQGMVKVGEYFFISAVELLECPQQYSRDVPEGSPDRTEGKGRGHLFKFSQEGNLSGRVELGEEALHIYHPGGIDYDGTDLWVPVAQYRPHSQSILYRVDPKSLKAKEAFRVDDHIGGVAFDPRDRLLHGISWGSRTFYTWTRDGDEAARSRNGSYYVDYQDCQFVAPHYMLCGGMNAYPLPGLGRFALGGLELVDLATHTAVHQVAVALYPNAATREVVMTRNPIFAEVDPDADDAALVLYFLPEDSAPLGEALSCEQQPSEEAPRKISERSSIYVYRVRSG